MPGKPQYGPARPVDLSLPCTTRLRFPIMPPGRMAQSLPLETQGRMTYEPRPPTGPTISSTRSRSRSRSASPRPRPYKHRKAGQLPSPQVTLGWQPSSQRCGDLRQRQNAANTFDDARHCCGNHQIAQLLNEIGTQATPSKDEQAQANVRVGAYASTSTGTRIHQICLANELGISNAGGHQPHCCRVRF
mgnify:CR=1 FL=1